MTILSPYPVANTKGSPSWISSSATEKLVSPGQVHIEHRGIETVDREQPQAIRDRTGDFDVESLVGQHRLSIECDHHAVLDEQQPPRSEGDRRRHQAGVGRVEFGRSIPDMGRRNGEAAVYALMEIFHPSLAPKFERDRLLDHHGPEAPALGRPDGWTAELAPIDAEIATRIMRPRNGQTTGAPAQCAVLRRIGHHLVKHQGQSLIATGVDHDAGTAQRHAV